MRIEGKRMWGESTCRVAQAAVALLGLFHVGQASVEPASAAQPELEEITQAYRGHYEAIDSLRVVYEDATVPLIDREVLWHHARRAAFPQTKLVVATQGDRIYYRLAMEVKSTAGVIDLLRKEDPSRFEGLQGDLSRLVTYGEIERLLPQVAPEPYTNTLVFDGSELRQKSPHPLQDSDAEIPTFAIRDALKEKYPCFRWLYPHFVLYPPLTPGLPKDLEHAQRSRIPELFSGPDASLSLGQEMWEGTDCTVLEVAGDQKLWLDREHGFAVRRREVHYQGRLQMVLEHEDLVEAAPGVWLPNTITKTDFGLTNLPEEYQGKPYLKTTLRVSVLEVNDPEHAAFFTLNPPAGAIVFDRRLRPVDSEGKPIEEPLVEGAIPSVSYVQPADAADLEHVVRQAQRDQGAILESRQPPHSRRMRWIFVLANLVILLAAVGGFLLSRWFRTARLKRTQG